MIIYKVTNLINGKTYIGKTSYSLKFRRRYHEYDARTKKYNSIFHAAIRKYGENNFRWEIIDRCLFNEALLVLEKHYICKFNSLSPDGYNLTEGGDGTCGHKLSTEVKQRMSVRMSGQNHPMFGKHPWNYGIPSSPETVEKLRRSRLGKRLSKETIEKIRKALIGRPVSDETRKKIGDAQRGQLGNNYGKHFSPEVIEKIRMASMGRKHSPEAIAKISQNTKRQWERNRALGNNVLREEV